MAGRKFGRNSNVGDDMPKTKLSKESLREASVIFSFIRPFRGYFIGGMLFLVLSSIASMGFPFMIGELVNSINGETRWDFLKNRNTVALFLIGLLAVQAIFSFGRVWYFANVSERSMASIRETLYNRIISLSISFVEKRMVGELTSRRTADGQQLQDVLSFALAEFLRQIFTILIGIPILIYLTPKLTVFMLLIFPVVTVAAVIFGRFIRKLSKGAQDALANTNVIVEESLQGIRNVKAFTNELFEMAKYRTALGKVVNLALKASVYRGAFITFIIVALFGTIVAVIWYGLGLVEQGTLKIGDLISFIMVTMFIGGAMAGVGDTFGQIQKALGASERIRALLDEQPELKPTELNAKTVNPIEGEITFDKVEFSYPARPEVQVLSKVSFHIPSGKKVALAGASGAGKSTIAQLLMHFYSAGGGEILIDGKPLESYEIQHLRYHVGVVPQDVALFGGTISENIAYGRPGASKKEIELAAQKANALEFIKKFPEGFETIVGERGVKLSGGQRQRIAIARAILKDPAILILDEATSSLDAESEKLVQDALNLLMEGRTTIIIAHRLATIREVDCIYVLDNGVIVESGKHNELAQREGGFYQNLLRLQFSEGND